MQGGGQKWEVPVNPASHSHQNAFSAGVEVLGMLPTPKLCQPGLFLIINYINDFIVHTSSGISLLVRQLSAAPYAVALPHSVDTKSPLRMGL